MENNFNTTAKPFQTNDKADNHASCLEAGQGFKFSSENEEIPLHRSLKPQDKE